MSKSPLDLGGRNPERRLSDEVLVHVESVGKKYCRNLKRSLWYGVRDIAAEINPFRRSRRALAGAGSAAELRKDEFWAVGDASFELRRGECLGLIGHNGAGKTTLLKMLNGLIKPDKGRIEMKGRVGALIALGAGFNPILTGRENIYVNGSVIGLKRSEIDNKIDDIIDFAEIGEFIDMPVQSYSSGMVVRLGFAIAVNVQPDILLLDEVLAVGDIGFQAKCLNTLAEFKARGVGFILVSHNMRLINRYADRVLYLQRGHVRHSGGVAEGVDLFMRDMDTRATESRSRQTDWSKVYGSGKVVLKQARFCDEAGAPLDHLIPGDSFNLALDFECPGESVANVILDIVISDKDGVLFQCTSANFNTDYGTLPAGGVLVTRFGRMPVNGTEISFAVAILDAHSLQVHDWKQNIRLPVRGDPRLSGRLVLDVEFLLP